MSQLNETSWNKLSVTKPEDNMFCWCYIPKLQKRSGVNLGFWQQGRFCDLYGYVWGQTESVTHYKVIEVPEPPMHEILTNIVVAEENKIKERKRRSYEKKKLEMETLKAASPVVIEVITEYKPKVKKTRLKRIIST